LKIKHSWAWWRTPLIPALRRQVDFGVQGRPALQSEFQDSQGCTENPCLKKPKTKQNKTKQKNNNKKTNNQPPPPQKKKRKSNVNFDQVQFTSVMFYVVCCMLYVLCFMLLMVLLKICFRVFKDGIQGLSHLGKLLFH
jgi:hypothetical protein